VLTDLAYQVLAPLVVGQVAQYATPRAVSTRDTGVWVCGVWVCGCVSAVLLAAAAAAVPGDY
jgi:predicted Na+-dependent transporter